MSSLSFRASLLTITLGLTALGSTLTPTGAYAHFSSGSFGGNISSVGSFGHVPTSTAVARAPVAAAGHSVARSSLIARLPVGTGKTGGHRIPTISEIAQAPRFPLPPPAPGTGPNSKPPPVAPNGKPPVVIGPNGIPVAVGIAVGATVGDAVGGTVDGQVAAGTNCNCLTKQYLNDGSVLFQDICTREAAIATRTN